ncbi:hypothetical protein BAJUN_03270 [Bajunvirus bajun]|uniref:Uncharacterized protein n=1 Tax=Brevundimonas phage vB_BgoS-Bajun TaxID=2948594 RepID=A0A9E7SS52_9CAUD|nr:hypothetical protein BAJUN_03270 [Brevundimonas phage vB_BgoS-Bajun]
MRATALDPRYEQEVSNATKVTYICGCIGYPEPAFDLETPFPVDDWLMSEDKGLLCAGLYLNDMREQFYALTLKREPERRVELFGKQGEAEFWRQSFHVRLTRRERGVVIPDSRVLH